MSSSLVKIVTGKASSYLADKIAKSYGKSLGIIKLTNFSDGEFQVSYEETVRGNEVFIIQSTFMPTENLFELLLMIDAAKRASAKSIIGVIPYLAFARQDRKDKPRVAIGAKLVVNLLKAAGVDRVITMDLHADQIQGFFDIPVDHLFASSFFIPYIQNLKLDNIVMASPDTGGTKRAAAYANHLKCDFVMCYKSRKEANKIDKLLLVGDVNNKNVIIVDDIIDTGGTLVKAAEVMIENGAASVRAICSHPLLSGQAYQNIEKSLLTELIVSDTIPLKANQPQSKITVISCADLFADVISRVHNNESISTHYTLNTYT